MSHLFCIGGTRFVGRHAVEEFLDTGYEVTLFNRGNHENPFDEDDRVSHTAGDRTNEGELRLAVERADPDVVVDTVAYFPRDVRAATDICGDVDVDAYVYVSSGAAYGAEEIPKREGETALCECTTEQATEDSAESYGPRKAEGDRAVFEAAGRGVNAMSVRPPVVYGPHDYTERFDYWIDRVLNHDRIVVPGDGTNVWQKVFVEDVASALRVVAERGEPGEAYNVGDEDAPTLAGWIERIADAADTTIEPVFAGPRELEAGGLELHDFPGYRDPPHLLDLSKLRDLGWASTPHESSLPPTVEEHRESDRTGRDEGPDREAEERVLSILETF
jgi:nucleoside-diphosphate-sugar epimerase